LSQSTLRCADSSLPGFLYSLVPRGQWHHRHSMGIEFHHRQPSCGAHKGHAGRRRSKRGQIDLAFFQGRNRGLNSAVGPQVFY
jgi:hypothetical protein